MTYKLKKYATKFVNDNKDIYLQKLKEHTSNFLTRALKQNGGVLDNGNEYDKNQNLQKQFINSNVDKLYDKLSTNQYHLTLNNTLIKSWGARLISETDPIVKLDLTTKIQKLKDENDILIRNLKQNNENNQLLPAYPKYNNIIGPKIHYPDALPQIKPDQPLPAYKPIFQLKPLPSYLKNDSLPQIKPDLPAYPKNNPIFQLKQDQPLSPYLKYDALPQLKQNQLLPQNLKYDKTPQTKQEQHIPAFEKYDIGFKPNAYGNESLNYKPFVKNDIPKFEKFVDVNSNDNFFVNDNKDYKPKKLDILENDFKHIPEKEKCYNFVDNSIVTKASEIYIDIEDSNLFTQNQKNDLKKQLKLVVNIIEKKCLDIN